MKHLIFADPHAHAFTQFATGGEGKSNSRLLSTLNVIDEIREFAITQDIKSIICLGDLFHSANSFRFEHFNAIFECIRKFKESGLELTLILGNHDLIGRTAEHGSKLDTLRDVCDLMVHPTVYSASYQPFPIHMLPYEKDFKKAIDTLDAIPSDAIVLHHLDIVGADTGHGYVSEIGIGRDNFSRFKLSLGGHYHKKQMVLENCFYIGCCCPQSFVEKDQYGCFVTLDDETLELIWYNTSAPVFREWDPELTADCASFSSFHNSYVRVKAEPSSELEATLRQAGALRWIFVPEKRKQIVQQRQSEIDVDSDLLSATATYVEMKGSHLNKADLIRIGQDLVKESL